MPHISRAKSEVTMLHEQFFLCLLASLVAVAFSLLTVLMARTSLPLRLASLVAAKSCSALTALNRWCLSGTPLQNRVGEFYSLIRFLRIEPMSNYMCKAKHCSGKGTCDCNSMHYR